VWLHGRELTSRQIGKKEKQITYNSYTLLSNIDDTMDNIAEILTLHSVGAYSDIVFVASWSLGIKCVLVYALRANPVGITPSYIRIHKTFRELSKLRSYERKEAQRVTRTIIGESLNRSQTPSCYLIEMPTSAPLSLQACVRPPDSEF